MITLIVGKYAIKYAIYKKWIEDFENKSFSNFSYLLACGVTGVILLICFVIILIIALEFLSLLI